MARLFKYILSGIEAFLKGCEAYPPLVSMAFIKLIGSFLASVHPCSKV
jgi:hypothetical protein